MTERFEITDREPDFGSVYSEVIIDKTTGKEVCEDIYDTVQLLNNLNGEETPKPIYEMNVLELIRNKDTILSELTSKKLEYKKQEAKILLETDFKELKLTNEKMKSAYINDQLFSLKETIETYEHSLTIVNDLIRFRLTEMEVKTQ